MPALPEIRCAQLSERLAFGNTNHDSKSRFNCVVKVIRRQNLDWIVKDQYKERFLVQNFSFNSRS